MVEFSTEVDIDERALVEGAQSLFDFVKGTTDCIRLHLIAERNTADRDRPDLLSHRVRIDIEQSVDNVTWVYAGGVTIPGGILKDRNGDDVPQSHATFSHHHEYQYFRATIVSEAAQVFKCLVGFESGPGHHEMRRNSVGFVSHESAIGNFVETLTTPGLTVSGDDRAIGIIASKFRHDAQINAEMDVRWGGAAGAAATPTAGPVVVQFSGFDTLMVEAFHYLAPSTTGNATAHLDVLEASQGALCAISAVAVDNVDQDAPIHAASLWSAGNDEDLVLSHDHATEAGQMVFAGACGADYYSYGAEGVGVGAGQTQRADHFDADASFSFGTSTRTATGATTASQFTYTDAYDTQTTLFAAVGFAFAEAGGGGDEEEGTARESAAAGARFTAEVEATASWEERMVADHSTGDLVMATARMVERMGAGDTPGGAPALLSQLVSGAAGDDVLEALATAAAAIAEGSAAGEAWAAQAETVGQLIDRAAASGEWTGQGDALAQLLQGTAAGAAFQAETDDLVRRALEADTAAGAAFVGAASALAGLHAGATLRGAVVAIVTIAASVSSRAIARAGFVSVVEFLRAFVARASAGDTWVAESGAVLRRVIDRARLSGILLAATSTATRLHAGARARARFIVSGRRGTITVGAVTLLAAIAADVRVQAPIEARARIQRGDE